MHGPMEKVGQMQVVVLGDWGGGETLVVEAMPRHTLFSAE